MPYPKTSENRAKFWLDLIGFSRKRTKPLFEACDVLVNQYFNEASTDRERDITGEEEHVKRTKAGIIYGWIDQTLSNMIDREPIIQCFPENKESALPSDPSDPSSMSRAGVTSKINNYVYRSTKQLRVDEKVAFNAMVYPYGVVKIGYHQDFDQRTQELLQLDTEFGDLETSDEEDLFLEMGRDVRVDDNHDHVGHIASHEQHLRGVILTAARPPDEMELIELTFRDHIQLHKDFHDRPNVDANTAVRREFPYAVSWPPRDFLTDVHCTEGPPDARWVAFGWELPIDEVRYDPTNENTKDLKPSRFRDAPDNGDGSEDRGDGLDVVRGWEIWAKNFPIGNGKFRDLLINVAEDHPKLLRYEEEWPYDRLDDYPAETLSFQSGIRNWFHKPPLLMGGGDTVQALMNEILDGFLYTIRKQKNLWLVDPASGIDHTILQDILDAPDGSIVEVKGLMDSGGKGIMPMPFLQIPPEKGEMLSILQNIFDRSVGTPQPQRNASIETATESSIIEKRNSARENRRAGLLSEFQIRKSRKMWQLITQFQPDTLYLIDRNALTFVQVTAEIARGEYLFTMDVSSASTSLAVERSQWMDLLNLFAGLTPVFVEFFGGPPNLPEIARRLLVRGFDEKVVEEILPMLEQLSADMQKAGAVGTDKQGAPIAPEAQAQQAIVDGRGITNGAGPLLRDSFQEGLPSEGKQIGNAETA